MHDSPETPAEPRRILVVRNRYVGDTMLAIPFLRNLRRRFPHAVINILCESGAATLLADCPYTDELLDWKRPPRVRRVVWGSLANVRATARWIRGHRYDRVYLLKRSLSTALLAWLAGIPVRVGFRSFGAFLLSRVVTVAPHRHQAELFLDLLRADGIAVDDGRNECWTTPDSVARADALLAGIAADRPRVFLAPQSTDVERLWPLDRFARIVEWLVAERGCEVFLCGAQGDARVHDDLLRRVSHAAADHVHDFSTHLSLRDVGGLLARMDVCLGVDTGLPHIAASNGVPVVVLAGPTDPNRWHPWRTTGEVVKGQPTAFTRLLRRWRRGGRALPWAPEPAPMRTISVEQVAAAVDRLLPRCSSATPEPRRPRLKIIDLREGGHRYEVWHSPPSAPAAAAEPATKPLAHAH
ncbi:MAG: glycosyltransferase family 9 protein [Planctomycetia bacterium]